MFCGADWRDLEIRFGEPKTCGWGRKAYSTRGLTLVETVLAVAILVIITAAVLPQFRLILGSWDSKESSAEMLQNGRVLMDHMYRNLSKAVQLTAVSSPSATDGYIEFEDNDANVFRYDISSTTNYVEFGLVDSLSDLAGPVSQLQFTCYDVCDLDTAITTVEDIRSVKVEAVLTNSGLGSDKTFTTQAYLRTNLEDGSDYTISTPAASLEFDTKKAAEPALWQIDNTHYLCAYRGDGDDGWAVVLTVDTSDWSMSNGTPYKFDTEDGRTPALSQIDSTHYLCAYEGDKGDGWAVVLTVNTGSWTISKETPYEYDDKDGKAPALYKIDNTHYLCAYEGDKGVGWAVVLTVNTGSWTISKETPRKFDNDGKAPALYKIDDTHYLCAYEGDKDDGWANIFSVDTGDWTLTEETEEDEFEFDQDKGKYPALAQIDNNHFLCAYQGDGDNGCAVILTVDTSDWSLSKATPCEFDIEDGRTPALSQIDSTHYLCAYEGNKNDGWAVVLTVNTTGWSVSNETPFEFDTDKGKFPALAQVDDTHYLCVYHGAGDDGYAVVLALGTAVQP